tara:strand:- start:58 stop:270 length:213 start_codon:yes stop_codon:yes gene_type:complete
LHDAEQTTKLLEERQHKYFDQFENILTQDKHDLKKMYIEMGSTIKVLENQIAALKTENADLVTKEKNSDL